jgi:hypothetical protein
MTDIYDLFFSDQKEIMVRLCYNSIIRSTFWAIDCQFLILKPDRPESIVSCAPLCGWCTRCFPVLHGSGRGGGMKVFGVENENIERSTVPKLLSSLIF